MIGSQYIRAARVFMWGLPYDVVLEPSLSVDTTTASSDKTLTITSSHDETLTSSDKTLTINSSVETVVV